MSSSFPPPLPTGCCPFVRSGGLHGKDCADLGLGRCTTDIGQVTAAGKAAAKEADTEPGIFSTADAMALRKENLRLERSNAALTKALAERESLPPPMFSEVGSRQRRVRKVGIELGKFAVLLPVAGLLLRAAANQWPEFGGLIEGALEALGL